MVVHWWKFCSPLQTVLPPSVGCGATWKPTAGLCCHLYFKPFIVTLHGRKTCSTINEQKLLILQIMVCKVGVFNPISVAACSLVPDKICNKKLALSNGNRNKAKRGVIPGVWLQPIKTKPMPDYMIPVLLSLGKWTSHHIHLTSSCNIKALHLRSFPSNRSCSRWAGHNQ